MAATVYMAIFLYNAVSPPVLFHNLPLLSAFCSKPKSCLLHKGDQALEQVARKAVETPSLEIIKTQLDAVLSNLLQLILFSAGWWSRQSQELPSHLILSVIL